MHPLIESLKRMRNIFDEIIEMMLEEEKEGNLEKILEETKNAIDKLKNNPTYAPIVGVIGNRVEDLDDFWQV